MYRGLKYLHKYFAELCLNFAAFGTKNMTRYQPIAIVVQKIIICWSKIQYSNSKFTDLQWFLKFV